MLPPEAPRPFPLAGFAALAAAAVLAGCGTRQAGRADPGALLVSDRGGAFRVYRIEPLDGSARLVGSERADDRSYEDRAPTRLPDGRIAFVSTRGGHAAIYVAPAEGGPGATRLLPPSPVDPEEGVDSDPSVLGRDRIVFARAAFDAPAAGPRDLYVAGIDGRGLRRLTRHPADDGAPAGSPDGRSVAFVSDRGGIRRLYLIPDVDTADPEASVIDLSRAAPPSSGSAEAVRPFADADPVFLEDGSLVFRRAAQGSAPQLYLMGGTGGRVTLRQITDSSVLPLGAAEPVPQPDGTVWFVAGLAAPAGGGGKPARPAVYRIALGGFNLSRVTREGAPYDDYTRRLRAPGT
jgi:hypothetical protein